jgi:hypothetical protein
MDLHPFQVSCNLLIATSPSDTWTHNPEHRLGTNGQSEKQLQYSAEKILVQTSSIFLNESFLERNQLSQKTLVINIPAPMASQIPNSARDSEFDSDQPLNSRSKDH